MKFPIVRSLEDLKTEDFTKPETVVSPDLIIGQMEAGEELGSFLSQETQAGRSVYLMLKAEKRMDGVFIVAAMARPVAVLTEGNAVDQTEIEELGTVAKKDAVS